MDLTQGSIDEKKGRARKTMMWFAMISMTMTFAGLTSAYVVSTSRRDWPEEFYFPDAFHWSTLAIILSSITLFLAKRAVDQNNRKRGTQALVLTLLLGLAFIGLQFSAFGELVANGINVTGPTSNPKGSFLYIIVVTHIAHVVGGILVLLTLAYNQIRGYYYKGQTLGLEIGAMYWHFVDAIWLYLILFFYFFRT